MAYTDYQQRAFYGAGQAAQRAGQRFHMERDALQRGDKAAAKYHRSRANQLNKQGAFAAVRGMGGNEGANQYFPVTSSGQPIQGQGGGIGITLSSAGRDIFDKFRKQGFVKPIAQKKRYAPNTEPRGVGWLMDQAMKNTMFAKMASAALPQKAPEPDDAYYKSLWGKGLNELYGLPGIFRSGKFLGKPDLDPYYTGAADIPQDYSGFMEPELNLLGSGDDFNIFDIYLENSKIPQKPEPYFGRGELPEDFYYGQFQTIPEEVLDDDIVNDVVIKQKPPFPEDNTFDLEIDGDEFLEESFNNKYSFINENPDLTPYEWVMTMIDETGGTMEEIIQNGILNGIIIEN